MKIGENIMHYLHMSFSDLITDQVLKNDAGIEGVYCVILGCALFQD